MFESISLLLFTLYNVHALIVEPHKLCVKSITVSGPCHVCECTEEGIFNCHASGKCKEENVVAREIECEPEMTYKYEKLYCTCNVHGQWRSNHCRQTFQLMEYMKTPKLTGRSSLKANFRDLPEIKEGETCVPGKSYKVSCNICRCGHNNSLLCTKMACFQSEEYNELHKRLMKKKMLGAKDAQKTLIDTKKDDEILFKNETIEYSKPIRRKRIHLREEDLKQEIKKCVAGKIYKKGCQKCYCTNELKLKCIKVDCGPIKLSYRMDETEISNIDERIQLPRLPHVGVECEPGKVYEVDCNKCWCSDKKELSACSHLVCLDTDIYMANRFSGKDCNLGYSTKCTKCECINGKTKCTATKNCTMIEGKKLMPSLGAAIKTSLNTEEDKCAPNMSYRVHCNVCKCLQDGTLICTTNVCLTYTQVKSLEERFAHLLKNGL